jgi:hypothetical protein
MEEVMDKVKDTKKMFSLELSEMHIANLKRLIGVADIKGMDAPAVMELMFLLDSAKEIEKDKTTENKEENDTKKDK